MRNIGNCFPLYGRWHSISLTHIKLHVAPLEWTPPSCGIAMCQTEVSSTVTEVGMEACAGAHHWAQCLTSFAVKNQAMGHRVVLIVSQHVKRYVLGQKNDANDAAGICEAITRCVFPTLRSKPKRSKIFKPYIVFALR